MLDRKLLDNEELREDLMEHIGALAEAVSRQQCQYDSYTAAYEHLCKCFPWKAWDDRVRRIVAVRYNSLFFFFLHSQAPLQAKCFRLLDVNDPSGPVVTKCNKAHEALQFHEWEPRFVAAEYIAKTCHDMPYHFIFGEKIDIM